MTAAIYARYSSDRQRDTSLVDQERTCRARAEREGWAVGQVYSDAAMSGTRADRPGYSAMLADAGRTWTILLVEDLSRLSRDEVEGVQVVRRLEHRGVRLVGVSDGYDSDRPGRTAQRSIRALLSSLYLEDLAARTHRGQEGQIHRGFHAGGLAYGYRSVRGEQGAVLEVIPEQAAIVVEIWERFAAGQSPRRIAADLNARGVPAKGGKTWCMSALYGHPAKGTGILRNPLYLGRLIWNRSQWLKDPDTSTRTRRERPQGEWIIRDVPALRIIPAELAARVERRHRDIEEATRVGREVMHNRGAIGPRPKYLLSGLLVCGNCGAPWVTVNQERYGCSAARYRGDAVCDVKATVTRDRLERRILDTVRGRLFSAEALTVYRRELLSELKRLSEESRPDVGGLKRRVAELDARIVHLVESFATGLSSPALRAALEGAEDEKRVLVDEIAAAERVAPVVPLVADIEGLFRDQIEHLEQELSADTDAARSILLDLVGKVRIVRHDDTLVAELTGLYRGVYANDGSGGRIQTIAQMMRVVLT